MESLCAQIDAHYDLIFKHVPLYSSKKSSRKRQRMIGEIDVLAVKDGYVDVFEVKCSHRIVKAKKQLVRIRKALRINQKLRHIFFFCGESGRLEKIDAPAKF